MLHSSHISRSFIRSVRTFSSSPMSSSPDSFLLYPISKNAQVSAKELWNNARPKNEVGETKLFYATPGGNSVLTAITSVGDPEKYSAKSEYAKKEIVRKAVGNGVKALRDAGAKKIGVDTSLEPHSTAVGAKLGLYKFTTLRTKDADKNPIVDVVPLPAEDTHDALNWKTGVLYADCQNLARELMELPANILTPTSFCERAKKVLADVPDVTVTVHDKEWAQEKGMNTFLSVTKGTDEPPKFLEIFYQGAPSRDEQPLAFVGKGITFDSGGISIKPRQGMKLMRGDMGGAATVLASTVAIAKLKLPLNLVTVIPLTENMPGPSASKPGDIVFAMNGKTVEIDNTDAEGRLILADALYYATTVYKPHTVLDVATLTGAMLVSLGGVYSGVFSSSDSLWEELHVAGESEHDRFWRMPLDEEFGPLIRKSNADLCNTGGPNGGSCTAALFLKEFVDGVESEDGKEPALRWAHIDIAGAMEALRAGPYTPVGMTGRPTRALIEFARRLSTKN